MGLVFVAFQSSMFSLSLKLSSYFGPTLDQSYQLSVPLRVSTFLATLINFRTRLARALKDSFVSANPIPYNLEFTH